MRLLERICAKILELEEELARVPRNQIGKNRLLRTRLEVWREALELAKNDKFAELLDENKIRYGDARWL